MKRKLTAFCISAALLCGVMPAFPAAAEDWNDLEYVRWKLEEIQFCEDGALIFIGSNAFAYQDTITEITLPETLETLNTCAFQRCDELRYPLIPASVTSIEEKAFNSSGTEAICLAGTQEQWNAIAKPADDSTLAKRTVRFGVQPMNILSADLNADDCVDAVDSTVMLQYAAAGSGYAEGLSGYLSEIGSQT